MSELVDVVRRTLERHRLVPPGGAVLVGLSGGPDSVALADVLRRLGHRLVLAHVHHGLRDDAEEDEALCARLARAWGLPLVVERADVRSLARREGVGLEEAGRRARYRFFEAAADRHGCVRIAVGHTKDDQAETVLFRLLRGAAAGGLAAMRPARGRIVRPLLEARRAQVLAHLAAAGLPFREDPTNGDPRFARNRIRHEALPWLAERFNPALTETLARNAALLADEDAWMEEEARRVFERVRLAAPSAAAGTVELSASALGALHPALVRRVLRTAIRTLRADALERIGAAHIDDALRLLAPGKSGRRIELPGLAVERSFDRLRLRPRAPVRADGRADAAAPDGYNEFEYPLPVPGVVPIPEAGGAIRVEETRESTLSAAAGRSVVVGLADATPLVVRSPRPGDRFRPLGAPGRRPLARYLMERRVDRRERRRTPVVARGGEILWVVGHGISEASRVGSGRRLRLSWLE